MTNRTITKTTPSLTKQQATQHLEVYQLAVNNFKIMNSQYLKLNNRRYGGWSKNTKASLTESFNYYRGKLHAFETILRMVNEDILTPSFNMKNFEYDKSTNMWSLSEGVDELIDFRYESYSERILNNLKIK